MALKDSGQIITADRYYCWHACSRNRNKHQVSLGFLLQQAQLTTAQPDLNIVQFARSTITPTVLICLVLSSPLSQWSWQCPTNGGHGHCKVSLQSALLKLTDLHLLNSKNFIQESSSVERGLKLWFFFYRQT